MEIICTTPALAGLIAEADRECDAWFEADVIVQHHLCHWIYPKAAWAEWTALEL